jgi:uncharacterized protein
VTLTEACDRLLLAGASVRMLAQSAARDRLRPVSLDLYADTDTAACSRLCREVALGEDFDLDRMVSLADRYAPRDGRTALIYGGGFDSRPEVLEVLVSGRRLWGNPPDLLRRVNTPGPFLDLLDRLAIPYPETRWELRFPERDSRTWLVKKGRSQGGLGVRYRKPDCAGKPLPGHYYQRYVDAIPRSLLFLANGVAIEPVGFNTLETARHIGSRPFLFAGAATDDAISARHRGEMLAHARALTGALSLIGLNSLDFVIDGGTCRVLELNARPSASMTLYDAETPFGLVNAHIAACCGRLISQPLGRTSARGFRILYAGVEFRMPADFVWPEWASDRPRPGLSIPWGNPVCSIRAESPDRGDLNRQLFSRERELRTALVF